MAQSAHEFIPTRRSLLSRLKQWDDRDSWDYFSKTYRGLLFSVALKSGLSDSEAQEAVQETLISVARKMSEFKYDPAVGSFKGWLLQVTRRRIADQFRKRPRESCFSAGSRDQTTRTATVARVPDPSSANLEAVWDDEWRKNLVGAALERVKRRVKPHHYQLFELYTLKEWPVDRITAVFRVTTGQVYRARFRVANLLKLEIQRLQTEMQSGSVHFCGRRRFAPRGLVRHE